MNYVEKRIRWAVLWRYSNEDQKSYLICQKGGPILFASRDDARKWIKRQYGYIAEREDLRKHPHHWLMPAAVRAHVTYEVITAGAKSTVTRQCKIARRKKP